MGRDITDGRHGGAETSRAAFARSVGPATRERQRSAIISYLATQDATCEEVAMALEMRTQSCYPRFSEMKKSGIILDTGQRRPTISGCMARVMRLVTPWEAPLGAQLIPPTDPMLRVALEGFNE